MEQALDYPDWMTQEAIDTLNKGYLQPGETPNGMYLRLARTAANYYADCYDALGITYVRELQVAFYNMFTWGWFSPASPVACNFGAPKFMPVSCFLQKAGNTIDGIFSTAHEAAMLSKNGGGLGIDVSDLIGESSVADWGQVYDVVASKVNQGQSRRGAVAIYCDIDHRDIEAFLHTKELSIGDPRDKIYSNIAVIVTDDFMNRLIGGDLEAKKRFSIVLRLRMKFGSPYLMFVDNANRDRCAAYVQNELFVSQSNLCIEIFEYTDVDHTANCVLSSLNLAKYDEWKGYRMTRGQYTIPELAIFFLDAVQQEFIDKARDRIGFERSARAAIKGRPLGLGVVGLHSLYQSRNVPFASDQARSINTNVFSSIQLAAERATRMLAKVKGEPEWCKGLGVRNSLLLAIAPTTTNSILCNAGSPGIEPCFSNYFVQMGAKGNFTRKNQYLEALLESKKQNTPENWEIVRRSDGSVQGLECLNEHEKEVFKTFAEIDPFEVIRQAADRQKFIDQGQSLNLYIPHDTKAETIIELHLLAWKLGLKGLYYVRSDSATKKALQNENIMLIHIKTREDCSYCSRAKELLKEKGIPYTEESKMEGRVPEIWFNGGLLPDGYSSLVELLGEKTEQGECASCEG